MLDELSALAIVPKAKAIAARRLTKNEYESLARKRSVIEVTADVYKRQLQFSILPW